EAVALSLLQRVQRRPFAERRRRALDRAREDAPAAARVGGNAAGLLDEATERADRVLVIAEDPLEGLRLGVERLQRPPVRLGGGDLSLHEFVQPPHGDARGERPRRDVPLVVRRRGVRSDRGGEEHRRLLSRTLLPDRSPPSWGTPSRAA